MPTKTEGRAAASFLLSEAAGQRSRGALLIGASLTVRVAHVLGQVTPNAGAVTVNAPTFAGTGNGTLTLADPAYGAGVQEGDYKVSCVEKTTDSGKFVVSRPDGTVDGYAVVGTAYVGQIKFTIADGATDFDQTAEFTVNVVIAGAADESQYKTLNLSAADGSQHAAAIALYPATTGVSETVSIAGIVRDAEVNGAELEWPDGITADEKAGAIAELAARGIIVR